MYSQFYQLKRAPFHATPDPEFLFLSAGHREALASLTYGIEKRKGFIALIGEDGLGKTTVLRCYLEGSDRARFKPVYIFNADVRFAGLLKTIHRELGLDVDSTDAFELVGALHEELIEKYRQGQNVVLIIDEAQNMPTETLENLRVLSNLETSTDKLLQIVLVGQPELQKRLSQAQLRQLNQRLAVRCSLAPLGPEESLAYIEHRLSRVAMGTESVFTPDALKTVVKHAGGVPRLINILCDNALIAGYAGQHRPVTAKLVKGVIAELTGARKGRLLRWGLAAFGLIGLTTAWYAVPAFQRWVDNGARNWGEPRETTFSDVRSGAASVSLSNQIVAAVNPAPEQSLPAKALADQSMPAPDTAAPEVLHEVSNPDSVSSSMEGSIQAVDLDLTHTTQPVAAPAAADAEPSSSTPEPAGDNARSMRLVKKGDTLGKLIREHYGSNSGQLIAWVMQNNPGIRNANRIVAGSTIFLPQPPKHSSTQ